MSFGIFFLKLMNSCRASNNGNNPQDIHNNANFSAAPTPQFSSFSNPQNQHPSYRGLYSTPEQQSSISHTYAPSEQTQFQSGLSQNVLPWGETNRLNYNSEPQTTFNSTYNALHYNVNPLTMAQNVTFTYNGNQNSQNPHIQTFCSENTINSFGYNNTQAFSNSVNFGPECPVPYNAASAVSQCPGFNCYPPSDPHQIQFHSKLSDPVLLLQAGQHYPLHPISRSETNVRSASNNETKIELAHKSSQQGIQGSTNKGGNIYTGTNPQAPHITQQNNGEFDSHQSSSRKNAASEPQTIETEIDSHVSSTCQDNSEFLDKICLYRDMDIYSERKKLEDLPHIFSITTDPNTEVNITVNICIEQKVVGFYARKIINQILLESLSNMPSQSEPVYLKKLAHNDQPANLTENIEIKMSNIELLPNDPKTIYKLSIIEIIKNLKTLEKALMDSEQTKHIYITANYVNVYNKLLDITINMSGTIYLLKMFKTYRCILENCNFILYNLDANISFSWNKLFRFEFFIYEYLKIENLGCLSYTERLYFESFDKLVRAKSYVPLEKSFQKPVIVDNPVENNSDKCYSAETNSYLNERLKTNYEQYFDICFIVNYNLVQIKKNIQVPDDVEMCDENSVFSFKQHFTRFFGKMTNEDSFVCLNCYFTLRLIFPEMEYLINYIIKHCKTETAVCKLDKNQINYFENSARNLIGEYALELEHLATFNNSDDIIKHLFKAKGINSALLNYKKKLILLATKLYPEDSIIKLYSHMVYLKTPGIDSFYETLHLHNICVVLLFALSSDECYLFCILNRIKPMGELYDSEDVSKSCYDELFNYISDQKFGNENFQSKIIHSFRPKLKLCGLDDDKINFFIGMLKGVSKKRCHVDFYDRSENGTVNTTRFAYIIYLYYKTLFFEAYHCFKNCHILNAECLSIQNQ